MFRIIALLNLLITLCLLVSACGLTADERAEISNLKTKYTKATAELQESAAHAEEIWNTVTELREKAESGTLSLEDAGKLSTLLVDYKIESARYERLKDDAASIKSSHDKLAETLPWYEHAGIIGLLILNGLFSTGLLVGNGKMKIVKAGVDILTNAIERGGTSKEIKSLVNVAANPYVEKIVKRQFPKA